MKFAILMVAVSALALVSCSAMSPGPKDAPTPEPTGTPIATSTPLSVVDALQASLLPEGEVGAEWSRIPADPRVTRIEGDDTSVRSACAPFRGPAAVTYVAGAHLAGPKAPSDIAKPQWYETIAVFASVRSVQNYMEMSKLDCTAQGESVEQLFDPLGDSSVYVQYGVPEPTQSHRVLLVRRGNSLMQIR